MNVSKRNGSKTDGGKSDLCIRANHVLSPCEAVEWSDRVLAARSDWTPAFSGEQYSLGRAFYTHFEESLSEAYFENAAKSDALVEHHLPGMQSRVRAIFESLVGDVAKPRRGWCGPGVHVFPAGGEVAKKGGVIHYDTEGLALEHLRRRAPALSLIVMLQRPDVGGGLKIWDARYSGRDEATAENLGSRNEIFESDPGDAIVMDSYRLHQIQGFAGARDRVSITMHACLVDRSYWEVWF